MVVNPLVRNPNIIYLDNQLVEWYDNLPAILKDHEPCSESFAVERTIMRWRYFNQRLLLYRPTLLSYAMRRVPYIALRSEERSAIEKCREIADLTIQDISATSRPNQMSGWNGVWLISQAVMVPILGLFLDDRFGDARASVESCQNQVEIAMLALARMQPWSPTAKRTFEVVSRLFDASKRGDTGSENHPPGSSYPEGVVDDMPGFPSECSTINGAVTDSFTPSLLDGSGQDLWDYLSWSDNSLAPGLADFESTGDLMRRQDKNGHLGLPEDMPDLSCSSVSFS